MTTLEKILYVDDEPDIQTIAQLALETVGGFTVRLCGSGKQAIDNVQGFRPQLLLLDVMMPEMDGPTTLVELRKLEVTASTPVIFMTAKVQPQEVAHYKSLGALDVIAKPFDPMTLSEQVKQIWESAT